MLFLGDFIQFPPVKDNPLYCGWNKSKTKSGSQRALINKQLGSHLWRKVNKIVLLDQQMRCTDEAYLNLLNRLREGKCNNADVEMLRGRIVGQNVNITSILDAPIITPGNQLVTINDLFIDCYSKQTRIHVSESKDRMGTNSSRKEVPRNVANQIRNWPNTSTKGLPRELKLYIGMPVIVTNTELGVTNGTTGTVRSIHLRDVDTMSNDTGYYYFNSLPDYVIVELNDIDMEPLDDLPPNHVPILLKSESFQVYMPGKQKNVSVNRRHFPIVPRFSCTAHKSQGQTLRKAIVDLVPRNGNIKYVGIEFAYVPLSRVRTLNDLTILRPFDPAILTARINEGCIEMMKEFKDRDPCKDM